MYKILFSKVFILFFLSTISFNINEILAEEIFIQDQSVETEFYLSDEVDFCLPELTPFFPTMLANPQIIGYSAGYRFYDKVFRTPLIPVSIGDQFSLYQFRNVIQGQLYLGIEACVWAIFEARPKSLSLINADYYVGIPLTYVGENFSARLRIYHESSHLGDEILIEDESIVRLNPSMEAVEFMMAFNVSDNFTLFGGYGHIWRSDDSFKLKPGYLIYGFNLYPNCCKVNILNLEAKPYVGVYINSAQNNGWALDASVTIGYQFEKPYGHKLRLYLEGHDGYAQDGQFSRLKSKYLALKILYGY